MDVEQPGKQSMQATSPPSPTTAAAFSPGLGGAPMGAITQAVGHYAEPPAKRPRTQSAAQPLAKRTKYEAHEHGAKKREQERLTQDYGNKVSGSTHESEHTIGFEPLSQTGDLKRGKSPRAKEIENHAPAYQESVPMHRAHIGTGTTNQRDASGFNSHEYRNGQRSLLESNDVSSAVQLNQLGYAFSSDFQGETGWQADAADDSYAHMVTGMDQVTYASGQGEQSASIPPMQKVEMLAARGAARTGQWPGRDDLKNAWAQLGYHEDD